MAIRRPVVFYDGEYRLLENQDTTPGLSIARHVEDRLNNQTPSDNIETLNKKITVNTEYNTSISIIINPGCILDYEISSSVIVDLPNNLYNDTLRANTYYYLYFDRVNNIFVFSSQEPLQDIYGNTFNSFEDCDLDIFLFYPNLNAQLVYISHVYVKNDSSILGYAKHKYNYWESLWTSVPGTGSFNIQHGFGKKMFNIDIFFKETITSDNISRFTAYHMGKGWREYGTCLGNDSITNKTQFIAYFAPNGIYRSSGAWQTSGIYKIILTGF